MSRISLGPTSSRARIRSRRNGQISERITIKPASSVSLAASAVLRTFSTRSASVSPRSLLSPNRRLSPSNSRVWRPCCHSLSSTRLAIVDLPAPDSPAIQRISGA
ncbi:hypothetical protein NS228_25775 [Methylobacterium indicum]|nr:hypothetical protein NS229_20730 [Methylobacterium indicum]KTS25744.1 hypothetical protein NS228_25775 [Methylobacterium indicum]KTS44585.1 hypothetical protein NS230_25245 [Methylobacterium indicum]